MAYETPFGDPRGDLGPYNLTWDAVINTGDTGDDLFLGGTKGTSVQFQDTKTDLTWDQGGTAPQNAVATGRSVIVNLALAQLTPARMAALMNALENYGTAGADGMAIADNLGEDDASIWKVLKMVKVIGGANSTHPQHTIFFPHAAPMVDTEIAGDAETQRQFAGKFRCYASEEHISTVTGKPLFGFTLKAVLTGNVTFL